MLDLNKIGLDHISKLSKTIRNDLFERTFNFKTTIFLCGADSRKKNTIRDKIASHLKNSWHSYRYDIFYPEDLFDELMFGAPNHDLLSLENVLADSVDVLLLILESEGVIAELGAFTANKQLVKKIICIQNKNFKKTRSFINYGPLRLLKNSKGGKDKIIYADYNNIQKYFDNIVNAISKTTKHSTKKTDVANVIQTQNFVLPCLYLLESVTREILTKMVECASEGTYQKAFISTTAALSILMKKKYVDLTSSGYRLTHEGLIRFGHLGKSGKSRSLYSSKIMDNIRLDLLSFIYRNKKFNYI